MKHDRDKTAPGETAVSVRLFRVRRRIWLRAGIVAAIVVGGLWLATWLAQRSMIGPAKRRAMQAWLDESLNADISFAGDMQIRLNLLRRSRVVLHNVEVEHPNPLFPGKFAVIEAMGAWAPPWAAYGIWPGLVEFAARRLRLRFEENESGEWNVEGLMQPLASGETPFPFPLPKMSSWLARMTDAAVSISRRGFDLHLDLESTITGRPQSSLITLRADAAPFTFTDSETGRVRSGTFGPGVLVADIRDVPDQPPRLLAGRCAMSVQNAPTAMLPFFLPGIPLENVPGVFNGSVEFASFDGADGAVTLEGELRDAPLAVFGLPRNAPLRVVWPVNPGVETTQATIRMGPSGFGAFELAIPMDRRGLPRQMTMRSDVAALDDIPRLLTVHSRWPDWLSRTFPALEWRASRWLGFGWSGEDMRLNVNRSTAGIHLTGEAALMKGRVRIAMTPGQIDSPITIAAERIDARMFAVKLSQSLPAMFKAHLSGAHANLTWRGLHAGDGTIPEWSSGMVFAKPKIDLNASGEWWRGLKNVSHEIADQVPGWGGGDVSRLQALAEVNILPLEQLSLVISKQGDDFTVVEFRAHGDFIGLCTGIVEKQPDGSFEGEMFLAGESELLRTVRQANPALGRALTFLANDATGLRVLFTCRAGQLPRFSYPFFDDAKRVAQVLEQGMAE